MLRLPVHTLADRRDLILVDLKTTVVKVAIVQIIIQAYRETKIGEARMQDKWFKGWTSRG